MADQVPAVPAVVATDLDGTLLRSDGTLSTRTRAAIASAEAGGVTVVFVTARPPRRLDDLADAVGAHGVAICGNGAFVYDVGARVVTECHALEFGLLREVVEDLRAAVPGIVFAVEGPEGMAREPGFVRRAELPEPCSVGTFEQIAVFPVGKLLGRCEQMEAEEFHERVHRALAGRAELGFSGVVGLAEITAPGITKATGLSRWCEARGVDRQDVWVFGDMPNDLPMLEWGGTSFAVREAHPAVRAAATHVCGSNDADGVAEMLEAVVARIASREGVSQADPTP